MAKFFILLATLSCVLASPFQLTESQLSAVTLLPPAEKAVSTGTLLPLPANELTYPTLAAVDFSESNLPASVPTLLPPGDDVPPLPSTILPPLAGNLGVATLLPLSNGPIPNMFPVGYSINSTDERIYNGPQTKAISYMASLQRWGNGAWEHFCGASVISADRLLSAAHCFPAETKNFYFRAVFGTAILNKPYQEIRFRHGDVVNDRYAVQQGRSGHVYDNAIVRLPERIKLDGNNIATVCLASQDYDTNTYWVTGWGYTDCRRTPIDLRYSYGQYVDSRTCEQYWRHYSGDIAIHEGQLCMQFRQESGEYLSVDGGDSGGPVVAVVNNQIIQIGIASFVSKQRGDPCPDLRVPQVFSRVAAHRQYISRNAPEAQFC